jgi:hypothetical protein
VICPRSAWPLDHGSIVQLASPGYAYAHSGEMVDHLESTIWENVESPCALLIGYAWTLGELFAAGLTGDGEAQIAAAISNPVEAGANFIERPVVIIPASTGELRYPDALRCTPARDVHALFGVLVNQPCEIGRLGCSRSAAGTAGRDRGDG